MCNKLHYYKSKKHKIALVICFSTVTAELAVVIPLRSLHQGIVGSGRLLPLLRYANKTAQLVCNAYDRLLAYATTCLAVITKDELFVRYETRLFGVFLPFFHPHSERLRIISVFHCILLF